MKKIIALVLLCLIQSCVFESQSNLMVNIINNSNKRVYVGELYDCDSCGIMQDVQLYCSKGNDSTVFPQMLNAGDSVIMHTRLHYIQKMDVINADSLADYCEKGSNYDVSNKEWVSVISEKVDLANKTCRIVIK